MQIIYTILFFADMIALLASSYFFLLKADTGHDLLGLSVLLGGVILSIALLVILLLHYMKPPSRHHQE